MPRRIINGPVPNAEMYNTRMVRARSAEPKPSKKPKYPMDGTFINGGVPSKPSKYQEIFLHILEEADGLVDKGYLLRKVNEGYNLKTEFDYVIYHAIGVYDITSRTKLEKRMGYPSLITYGYVHVEPIIVEGVLTLTYQITDKGKEALAKLPPKCKWARGSGT